MFANHRGSTGISGIVVTDRIVDDALPDFDISLSFENKM
jgi:hypothetical protein